MALDWTLQGHGGTLAARTWPNPDARYIALLCHGYGEHLGRYQHVAEALVEAGAVVHGLDLKGHGKSEGDRVLIQDFGPVVEDFHQLDLVAREQSPGLPVVVIGHSMGGLIATRYGQVYGDTLAALVLSGPVVGAWAVLPAMLAMDPIPEVPIDPATLSRDPAVGAAYAEDELVWHGAFRRQTLEGLQNALDTIAAGGDLGDLPTLWLHGEDDQLVPIDATRAGIEAVKGQVFSAKSYAGARHEIFNETNKHEVLADVTAFIDVALGPAAILTQP